MDINQLENQILISENQIQSPSKLGCCDDAFVLRSPGMAESKQPMGHCHKG